MAKKVKNAQPPWELFFMFSGACFWVVVLVIFMTKLLAGVFSIYDTYQSAKVHFAEGRDSVVIYRTVESNDDWIFSNATIEVKPRKEND